MKRKAVKRENNFQEFVNDENRCLKTLQNFKLLWYLHIWNQRCLKLKIDYKDQGMPWQGSKKKSLIEEKCAYILTQENKDGHFS